MTVPSGRKCWTATREIHIGTCADSWDGDVFCVCDPADQEVYDPDTPLHAGASIEGVSQANIKAYWNDVLFDTYYAESSSWVWMWAVYDSDGSQGTVRCDLCSGDVVIASRSTKWVQQCVNGETKSKSCPDGSTIITHNCVDGKWVATDNACPTCEHGDVKEVTCADGTKVVTAICIPPDWVDTHSDCDVCTDAGQRTRPCPDGSKVGTHHCEDGAWIPYENVCCPGETKTRICSDGSTIITHTCVDARWTETGDTCPPEPDEITCDTGGCALLNLYDGDNDGVVTSADALRAMTDGRTDPEVQFILDASATGSINALCPGCYAPPEPSKSPWMLLTIAIIGLYLYLRG